MSPEPFHMIHIPIPKTHTATIATEPFHHDTHIAIATTRTTIVAGGVAASYRDKKGREPNKAEAAPPFWTTVLAIQVQRVKTSCVHFSVCCKID